MARPKTKKGKAIFTVLSESGITVTRFVGEQYGTNRYAYLTVGSQHKPKALDVLQKAGYKVSSDYGGDTSIEVRLGRYPAKYDGFVDI